MSPIFQQCNLFFWQSVLPTLVISANCCWRAFGCCCCRFLVLLPSPCIALHRVALRLLPRRQALMLLAIMNAALWALLAAHFSNFYFFLYYFLSVFFFATHSRQCEWKRDGNRVGDNVNTFDILVFTPVCLCVLKTCECVGMCVCLCACPLLPL